MESRIIKSKSVYEWNMRLKEGVVTPRGFLDISQIAGIRVHGINKFFSELMKKTELAKSQFSKKFNVLRDKLRRWENSEVSIPLSTLINIANYLGIEKEHLYEYFYKNKNKFSCWTSNPLNIPLKIKDIDLDKLTFIYPYTKRNGGLYLFSKEVKYYLDKIGKFSYWRNENSDKVLYTRSRLFNLYLRTFFDYTKTYKLMPPLTRFFFNQDNINISKEIAALLILTEGSLNKFNRFGFIFINQSKILHNLLVDSIYFGFNKYPNTFMSQPKGKSTTLTQYTSKTKEFITYALLDIVKNFKTAPHDNQTVDDYYKEPQPTLNKLLKLSLADIKKLLSILMACEGSVNVNRYGGITGRVVPSIELACSHPALCKEIKQLFSKVGFKTIKRSSNQTWSGTRGLTVTHSIEGSIKFAEEIGFFPQVKVTGKSKYYKGIEKQKLLLSILEFGKLQKENRKLMHINLSEIHPEIKEIALNNKFKDISFYKKLRREKKL